MQEFIAAKKYYVHEFSTIQDWFGNRGIPIEKDDLIEWCYDGHYLYFRPDETAANEIMPSREGVNIVMICVLNSDCYECYSEIDYDDSPFANKINVKPFYMGGLHANPKKLG